jgi:molybdate transport system ATP-binding protein
MPLLDCRCRLRYSTGFLLDCAFTTSARVTALCGPSGSGKTSVLSVIAGLRRPDEGRIALGARTLFDSTQGINLAPEARRIGYVFQEHLLFPHLDVRRNLLYGWRRRPAGARAIDFDRVVQVLELGSLLERSPPMLSGGEKQRVALGRALLSAPALLLLDEPLAALDQPLKERILGYVDRALEEWRLPAVYVTHQLAEVTRLAEYVVIMEAGRVVFAGDGAGNLKR